MYWALARDSWQARAWADKLRVWFGPPGWRPPDVAARFPKPAFDLQRDRFDPPLSRARERSAALLFGVLLAATSAFLWHAHRIDGAARATAVAALVGGLWLVGRLCTPAAVAPR